MNKKDIKESFSNVNKLPNTKILRDWIAYYKVLDTSFSINSFIIERIDTLHFTKGNVLGNFHENFDKIYAKFIIYSPDKKHYIDFDSYQWSLDEFNKPVFSPDQEINLIDIDKQTVNRIKFNGPLQWVENAYWKDNKTIVLLENSYEHILRMYEIDIIKKEIKTAKYLLKANTDSKYSEIRFRKKGLKLN